MFAACLAFSSVAWPPPNQVLIELSQRDTPLLFQWVRPLYGPKKIAGVEIPSEVRHWFENRARRPNLPPVQEGLLAEGPIVILITVDALRTDILDPRHRNVAPNLHALRDASVYFAQARSSSTGTLNSLAALFTGRHQSMLTWTRGKGRRKEALKNDHEPRLPELLRDAGVHTVGAETISMMAPSVGMARGFVEMFDLPATDLAKHSGPSDQAITALVERLRRHGSGPLFFYTHFMEPHHPYKTYGKKVDSRFEAYLIEVSVVDRVIGRLRQAIVELGLQDRTALMVSADHGEGFGEHRIYTHGKGLYDVLVHVPLMIQLPSVRPRTVNDFVLVMDVAPTVLDLFGVATPGSWTAESLTPFLTGGRGDPSRVLLMEIFSQKALLFSDGIKAIKSRNSFQIYNVLKDPAESDNLWAEFGEEGERRIGLLEAYLHAHRGGSSEESGFDEDN